ncbi:MAG: hypothetical protein ACQES1_09885, partial [Bacteroidota bacterium]
FHLSYPYHPDLVHVHNNNRNKPISPAFMSGVLRQKHNGAHILATNKNFLLVSCKVSFRDYFSLFLMFFNSLSCT